MTCYRFLQKRNGVVEVQIGATDTQSPTVLRSDGSPVGVANVTVGMLLRGPYGPVRVDEIVTEVV